MKKSRIVLITALLLIGITLTCCVTDPVYRKSIEEKEGTNVLFFINENFGLNYVLMRDAMELQGWHITHLGIQEEIKPCWGIGAITGGLFVPDRLLKELPSSAGYDALLLPPGTGSFSKIKNPFGDILDSEEAMAFLNNTFKAGMPLFAMCMGVKVPVEAGWVKGREVVTTNKLKMAVTQKEGTFLGADHAPAVSGNLITGVRGQYYNYQNIMAVARAMEEIAGKKGDIQSVPLELVSRLLPSDETWQKRSLGTSGADGARQIRKYPGGGSLIGGYTFGTGGDDADMLLTRLDREGRVLWARSVGGPGTEYANTVLAAGDGCYAAGYTTSAGSGSRDLLVVKLDGEGNLIWQKTFGGPSWEVGIDTAACEGGLLVLGFTASESLGEEDLFLIKLDTSGNLIWEKRYGGKRSDIAVSLIPAPDGYYIGAVTGSFSKNSDFWLLKINAEGEVLMDEKYGGGGTADRGFDWTTGLFIDMEERPVIVGYSANRPPMGAWVVRADREGKELLNRGYKSSSFYNFGTAGFAGPAGITIVGVQKERDLDNNIFLLSLDEEGNILSEKILRSPGFDWAAGCIPGEDGSILLAGQTGDGSPGGDYDVLLAVAAP